MGTDREEERLAERLQDPEFRRVLAEMRAEFEDERNTTSEVTTTPSDPHGNGPSEAAPESNDGDTEVVETSTAPGLAPTPTQSGAAVEGNDTDAGAVEVIDVEETWAESKDYGTSLALLENLETAGALTSTGLRLSQEMTYDQFCGMLMVLGTAYTSLQFAIGDALLYGETLFGEDVYQAAEILGLSPETVNRYIRVAQRMPLERRNSELSWSHHFVVCTLSPADQVDWLQRAVDNKYSKHDLYGLLHPVKELTTSVDDHVTCPQCGANFIPSM